MGSTRSRSAAPSGGAVLLGDQRPRLLCLPSGVAFRDSGREAIEVARLARLLLDEWQEWLLIESLGETDEYLWAAFEILIIIARQNGKGGYLEARELAGLFLYGEELIIHTAHQFKTALEAFRRILRLIEGVPQFDQRVMRVSKSHGEEGIELKPTPVIIQGASSDFVTPSITQRLNFFARSETAGKGFTGDLLIYDESQDLEAADTASTLPTLSARPNPQVIYTGNAGTRKSTQVAKVRRRMIKGGDGSLFGAEWSIVPHNDDCRDGCREHDDDDDPRSLAKANPSLNVKRANRTGLKSAQCAKEARAMGVHSVEYRRERLGVGDYPDPSEGWAVIARGWWTATMVRGSEAYRPAAPNAFAISTTRDRRWSTVGLAGKRTDARVGVEIVRRERGTRWVLDEAVELDKNWSPCCWVIDSRDQAASMKGDLIEAGLNIIIASGQDMTHACGQIFDAYRDGTLAHTDDDDLRRAIAGADKRDMEAAWVFDRREDSGGSIDLGPLIAITLAHWGYLKFGPGADYDIADSVGWGAAEVIRLLGNGTYGPFDIVRLRKSGLLDDSDLKAIEAAGFAIPAGI